MIRTPFCGKPGCELPVQAKNQVSEPTKVQKKYTIEEFWRSLYWEIGGADEQYDGLLHIVSTINGTEVKIPIADIHHEASARQQKL